MVPKWVTEVLVRTAQAPEGGVYLVPLSAGFDTPLATSFPFSFAFDSVLFSKPAAPLFPSWVLWLKFVAQL